jgi:hypothetical protein
MKIVSENASENCFFNPLNTKYSGLLIDMFLKNDAKFSNLRLKINTNNVLRKYVLALNIHICLHTNQTNIFFNASIKNEDIEKVEYRKSLSYFF